MPDKRSDYVFHPPSGSSVPGKVDANPYMNYPPEELRGLIKVTEDEEDLRKMKSALRQWERLFDGHSYPFRKRMAGRVARRVVAELQNPPINLPYYQDTEEPEGIEGILESIQNVHDQDNQLRFDYSRQGERPEKDAPFTEGDFLSKSDGLFDPEAVQPRGQGPDPEGMENLFPTGGPIDQWPDML